MCLAIPGCITKLEDDSMATVNIMGATRQVSLDLTPEAKVGDYVLVHAGFAIEVVDPQSAQETLDLVQQMVDLVDDDLQPASAEATA
ncbi:MAG: HypC/HybG/HupF family hydrogenase formation chaperone [Eggerthellaceae bacterium]|jgi:hydrogenase expression/formation protein HypC